MKKTYLLLLLLISCNYKVKSADDAGKTIATAALGVAAAYAPLKYIKQQNKDGSLAKSALTQTLSSAALAGVFYALAHSSKQNSDIKIFCLTGIITSISYPIYLLANYALPSKSTKK